MRSNSSRFLASNSALLMCPSSRSRASSRIRSEVPWPSPAPPLNPSAILRPTDRTFSKGSSPSGLRGGLLTARLPRGLRATGPYPPEPGFPPLAGFPVRHRPSLPRCRSTDYRGGTGAMKDTVLRRGLNTPYELFGGDLSRRPSPGAPSPRVRFGRAQNGSHRATENEAAKGARRGPRRASAYAAGSYLVRRRVKRDARTQKDGHPNPPDDHRRPHRGVAASRFLSLLSGLSGRLLAAALLGGLRPIPSARVGGRRGVDLDGHAQGVQQPGHPEVEGGGEGLLHASPQPEMLGQRGVDLVGDVPVGEREPDPSRPTVVAAVPTRPAIGAPPFARVAP